MERVKGIIVAKEGLKLVAYIPKKEKYYTALPKGSLIKKEMKKAYVGDKIEGEIINEETIRILKIDERKNHLIRPKVANVDKVLVIFTIKNPPLNTFQLDKLLAVYDYYGVEPVVVFNKIDLIEIDEEKKELEKWTNIYKNAGYNVLHISAQQGINIDKLKEYLKENIVVLAGPSGVGKTSIINVLTGYELATNEVSEKTKRGRHTTVEIMLLPFGENSFLADTPGFSEINLSFVFSKEELKEYFREFLGYECKFSNCMHLKEPGCAVKEAVKNGEISKERYNSYLNILKEDYGVNIE